MVFRQPRRPRLSDDSHDAGLRAMQQRAYASEKEYNFRGLASLLATKSARTLTAADMVDDATYALISAVGQYAEIAHGSISPAFVFGHMEALCRPGFPFAGYTALKTDGARLVAQFTGSVARLQGYVAHRPAARQLVLAFSGTSSVLQALRDVELWQAPYPLDRRKSTVHVGFWKMYRGVRARALDALRAAFGTGGLESEELVLTGHSMGCTMCYLIALDLMAGRDEGVLPRGLRLRLVVFGSPRLGNAGLARYWKRSVDTYRSRFGEASFQEYSVKGHNDGVHALPPCFLGFRHLTSSPLYLYHGRIYRVAPSEAEHSTFIFTDSVYTASRQAADPDNPSAAVPRPDCVIWPKGGHNYYIRDMEKVQRELRWLKLDLCGEAGWEERYAAKLKVWEEKWGRHSDDSAPGTVAVI